jgi:hypothetical protein
MGLRIMRPSYWEGKDIKSWDNPKNQTFQLELDPQFLNILIIYKYLLHSSSKLEKYISGINKTSTYFKK